MSVSLSLPVFTGGHMTEMERALIIDVLEDVLKHARPAFPRTPYREALNRAKEVLDTLKEVEREHTTTREPR